MSRLSDHIECVWDMMNDEDPDFCEECADLGETCEYHLENGDDDL